LNPDLSKAYELLGVKPGVSPRDLKSAHRDLAKVWHPDRFLHDPRLQDKAQEKLKEINEAYELISSGKIPRSVKPPPPATEPQTVYTASPATPARARNGHGASVAVLLFIAVFAVTITALLQRRSQPLPQESVQIEEDANQSLDQPVRPDSNTRAEVGKSSQKVNADNSVPEAAGAASVPTEPTPAVETVTVTIDPETGLLAKSDCPVRSRMTYPSGSQPSAYCNLSHTPPPKDSRIKSITKALSR
jgi:hypothetical protein